MTRKLRSTSSSVLVTSLGCCRLGSDVNDGALGGVRAGAQTLDILPGQYRLRLVSDVLYLGFLPGQYRLRLVSDVLYLDILPGQYRLRLVSDVVYWYLSIGSCLRKHWRFSQVSTGLDWLVTSFTGTFPLAVVCPNVEYSLRSVQALTG